MGTTATGSLKDAGQIVGLGSGGALVGDGGLGGDGVFGKGRDGEEKEEERGGESFHGDLLRWEGSRAWGKKKGPRAALSLLNNWRVIQLLNLWEWCWDRFLLQLYSLLALEAHNAEEA